MLGNEALSATRVLWGHNAGKRSTGGLWEGPNAGKRSTGATWSPPEAPDPSIDRYIDRTEVNCLKPKKNPSTCVFFGRSNGGKRSTGGTWEVEAQDTLNREYDLRPADRAAGRTDEVIERELDVLRTDHGRLQWDYDDWMDRLSRGGDYLNCVLIHGTKLGTEANNYVRTLHRSTNGFEALRLLRLRYSGGQMSQNYQLLRELLNPKFTESQQHYQYRQWLETLSRYELEARQPLDDNLVRLTSRELLPMGILQTSTPSNYLHLLYKSIYLKMAF